MEKITKKNSILYNQLWINKAIEEGNMDFIPVHKLPGKSIGECIEIKYNQERHLTGSDAEDNLDKSLESIKEYIYDYECWQKSADNMYSSIICYSDGRAPKSGNYYSGEKPTDFWITYKDRYMRVRGDKTNRETIIVERIKLNTGKWKKTETVVKGRFETLQDYDKGKKMYSFESGY